VVTALLAELLVHVLAQIEASVALFDPLFDMTDLHSVDTYEAKA
jgi:hypothetical protein